jgi:hypothetical protein
MPTVDNGAQVSETARVRGTTQKHKLTLRLDDERWLRLREYALRDRRTSQQIFVDLLDELLAPKPETLRAELHVDRVAAPPLLEREVLQVVRPAEPLLLNVGSVDTRRAPRAQKLPLRGLEHAKAYAILDATVEVVFTHVTGLAMTRKQWRQQNKAGALAFAELSDWPPERIAAMMTFAYTHPEAKRYYGGTIMLAKFQEIAPKLTAIRDRMRPPRNDAREHAQ